MKALIKLLEVLNKPNSELTFREKCRKFIGFIVVGLFGIILNSIFRKIGHEKQRQQEARNKLKYFKPIIEEGLFSNKTTWVMRDNPLSEEQLDDFIKNTKS